MRFLIYDNKKLQEIVGACTYQELLRFTKFINDVAPGRLNITKINSTKKTALVNYLVELLMQEKNVLNIAQKLISTEVSSFLYMNIVWNNMAMQTSEIEDMFHLNLATPSGSRYGTNEEYLGGVLALIVRVTRVSGGFYYGDSMDILSMSSSFFPLLKVLLPIPDDFDLEKVEHPNKTDYSYTNEENVFSFISVASDMLKSNLVEFGKTGEKPLAKSLNILKASTGINEFYSEKKIDSLATDMLTRSFSYYYWAAKKFKPTELESLKDFIMDKFEDKYYFFITRVLLTHLKKVRFDHHYTRELGLFNALNSIVQDLPKDSWVSMENILKYSSYRELKFHLEYKGKTDNYIFESEAGDYTCDTNYTALFFEPVLRGGFFYLASLGLFELMYDKPKSNYNIKAKDKEYISVWDGLKYVKITELGKYIFGFSKKYEQKTIQKSRQNLKFDEYKPIITIDSKDTISQAKLEPFTETYAPNRYILSYAKIFKDCKSTKALELKIESFYKQIEKNPPQVFKDFFDEIKANQNLLKRDLKQVVIELTNNKKLLNLFMKNKKIQELVIKAQGYRVIVLKENIPKLTKIVKDNGFFVEF